MLKHSDRKRKLQQIIVTSQCDNILVFILSCCSANCLQSHFTVNKLFLFIVVGLSFLWQLGQRND